MKLVEIAGHLIDPGKVSYVGPLDSWLEDSEHRYFTVIVDGAMVDCTFDSPPIALAARQSLIAAIESVQVRAEIAALEAIRSRFSWPEYGLNEKGGHLAEDYLTGDCWPTHPKDNGKGGPSDALVGVEA